MIVKKTIGLALSVFIISFAAEAQKYKVKGKDGIVFKDKKEVGRVEGKVSVFRESQMDLYQNDELVLSLEEIGWKTPYKEFKNMIYYHANFPKLGYEFNIQAYYSFVNEKQVIKLLMAKNGLHIYEDGFKEDEVLALMDSDVVKSVEQDTVGYNQLLSEWRTAINENGTKYDSDIFEKVIIRRVTTDPEKIPKHLPVGTTHVIYRKIAEMDIIDAYKEEGDNISLIIGAMSYIQAEAPIGSNKPIHEIRIFRKVNTTVSYNNKKSRYAPIAYTDLNTGLTDEQKENQYRLYTDSSLQTYSPDNNYIQRAKNIIETLSEMDLM